MKLVFGRRPGDDKIVVNDQLTIYLEEPPLHRVAKFKIERAAMIEYTMIKDVQDAVELFRITNKIPIEASMIREFTPEFQMYIFGFEWWEVEL